jgi:hypothetical protein
MQRLIPVLLCCLCAGCFDPTALQVSSDETPEAETDSPVAPAGGAPPVAVRPGFPDVEAQVVDKQVAMAENPNLRETENEINAMDPLSAASQSYFALGSRIHLMNFKHQVDIMRELNDRYPTFDEFAEMMQTHDVEFKGLKPWQMYAYDSSDGTVCILEDLDVKRARYEAADIPYPE